jgi:hypothetical protein
VKNSQHPLYISPKAQIPIHAKNTGDYHGNKKGDQAKPNIIFLWSVLRIFNNKSCPENEQNLNHDIERNLLGSDEGEQ